MTEFGGTKIGVPLLGLSKSKLFNHSSQTHEAFRTGKFKGKIKYDQFQVPQLRSPSKMGPSKFLTTQARQNMKFSRLAKI